jgi:hypothetical protein
MPTYSEKRPRARAGSRQGHSSLLCTTSSTVFFFFFFFLLFLACFLRSASAASSASLRFFSSARFVRVSHAPWRQSASPCVCPEPVLVK